MNSGLKKVVRAIDLAKAIIGYKKEVSKLFAVPIKTIDSLYDELNTSQFLAGKVHRNAGWYYLSMLSPFRAPLLYVICRLTRPEVVVETGVKDGYSSSFILFALEMNRRGKLYSIDLPNSPGQELKGGQDTGWLVPKELHYRWSLILGSSQDRLPNLLKDLQKIDMFFHDSEHSYENMTFEFNKAWGYLTPGGYLCSDDITENNAFDDFVRIKGCRSFLKLFKSGIAIK